MRTQTQMVPITTKPNARSLALVRALTPTADPAMGKHNAQIHEAKAEEIRREEAARLAAFMREMANRD